MLHICDAETQRMIKSILRGRTPARREGGLVGAGRNDAWRRAITMEIPS
jgi:hypothetical protein